MTKFWQENKIKDMNCQAVHVKFQLLNYYHIGLPTLQILSSLELFLHVMLPQSLVLEVSTSTSHVPIMDP